MGNVYGYVRVSSQEQNEDRQLIAMSDIGISKANIYIDKQSGKDFNRPNYKRLIKTSRGRFTLHSQHRSPREELRRNTEPVVNYHKRKSSRHSGA